MVDSELEFEDFFQSSLNTARKNTAEEDSDLSSMSESIRLSYDEEMFVEDSEHGIHGEAKILNEKSAEEAYNLDEEVVYEIKYDENVAVGSGKDDSCDKQEDSLDVLDSFDMESQVFCNFDSDSFQFSEYLSETEEASENRGLADEGPGCDETLLRQKRVDVECSLNKNDLIQQRHPLSFNIGESLHISAIDLNEAHVSAEDESPKDNLDSGTEKSRVCSSKEIAEKDKGGYLENSSNFVFSGFTTGNNKRIEVKKESVYSACKTLGVNPMQMGKADVYKSEMVRKSFGSNTPKNDSRKRSTADLEKVYEKVRRRFPNDNEKWVFTQFKWTWLYFFLGKHALDEDSLVEKMEEQMKIRKRSEYSVLRRIIEGDDVPWRYMILLVIGITEEHIEVFDGSYSLCASYDGALEKKIRRKEIHVGCKLKVFGADIITNEPMSIFDASGVSLKLHCNGVRMIYSARKLGYRKKVTFRSRISSITREGGPVSCIQGAVVKVMEAKYLVKVENYSCTTDDIESELYKIEELAREAQRTLSSEDLRIKTYTKFLIKDESGECIVTWWNPSDEIKVGQTLRIIYLLPVLKSGELHLCTSKRTNIKFLG